MNVPQLRFSGFEEPWKEIKLGELVEFKNGLNYLKSDRGEIVYTVGVKNFNQKKMKSTSELESINLSSIPNKDFLVKKDDLLFVRSNGNKELVGRMLLIETDLTNTYYSGFVIRGRIKERTILEPLFLLSSESKIKSAMKSLMGGTNISNLSQSILNSLVLNVPSLGEQKKIASFISLIEQNIEKQQEKIEKLEQFKKGMMQKVFSQELRFKDEEGGKFPDWKKKKLDKCLDIENGFPFKSSYFTTEPIGMPLLRIRDIKAEKLNTYYTGSFDEKFLVHNQDIVIGMDGEFAVSKWNKGPALLNQRVMRIKNKEDYSLSYLYQLLKIVVKKIEDITPQTTVKHLSNKDIFNTIVEMPSFDEQLQIGNFFSYIDTKIEKEKDKLMVLEEQKKGFMQGMFV
ncbi:restriction endonuclease subunit S [Metaplanococcus flavidus]